jgi:hypothetical protein
MVKSRRWYCCVLDNNNINNYNQTEIHWHFVDPRMIKEIGSKK